VPGAKGPWIVQRPKVIWNNATRKFVLYSYTFTWISPRAKRLTKAWLPIQVCGGSYIRHALWSVQVGARLPA
jgi:hypothetical protein